MGQTVDGQRGQRGLGHRLANLVGGECVLLIQRHKGHFIRIQQFRQPTKIFAWLAHGQIDSRSIGEGVARPLHFLLTSLGIGFSHSCIVIGCTIAIAVIVVTTAAIITTAAAAAAATLALLPVTLIPHEGDGEV